MYTASDKRYANMVYNRCGKSGLKLPALSLGLWQNFGTADELSHMAETIFCAFDNGITHFDLANNYGPPGGEAERNFGKILKQDMAAYRDELIISTKAGYNMWPGPYGEWGSRKYMLASLDQSLKRLQLDYVDIFYSHRPDPETPIEETMGALDYAVRSGKALYAGISNYDGAQTAAAIRTLKQLGTPCVIHQPKYSMLVRWVEDINPEAGNNLLGIAEQEGVGVIAFSPLAQGMLTDKYLKGVPAGSRAGRDLGNGAITATALDPALLHKIKQLNEMALQRNQTLAQMAIAWLMKDPRVTSVLVGASSAAQLQNSIGALHNSRFSGDELLRIEEILGA